MDWPANVNTEYAEKDDLTPNDFACPWCVSYVRLRAVREDDHLPQSANIAAVYCCDIPAATPHANQYDALNQPIPDPVGMALAWVQFELRDAESGDVLDKGTADHAYGKVVGFLGEGAELWQRLTPGTSVKVKLAAQPKFYYLSKNGAMHGEYSNESDGYFSGEEHESGVYTLTMNQDGEISIQ